MKNPLTVDFQDILNNIEHTMYQIIMDTEHDNEYKCDSVRMYIDNMRAVVKDSTDMKDAIIKALADEVEEMTLREKNYKKS